MHVIHARNVAEALPLGVSYLLEQGRREQSRAGPVVVAPGPVTTVYRCPRERVLFSAVRDANPFFHLYESIWMLAGRNDVKPLTNLVKRFAGFAEPDGTVHGAYGHRWRHALGFDQLDHVVGLLKKDPTSRQAVIQMWDANLGVATGDGVIHGLKDLTASWRDRPCNTHVYLRVRDDQTVEVQEPAVAGGVVLGEPRWVLDLTVLCRSNDAIWGAHGANAVHFSVLQEYLAARIGVQVGILYQVSNNYHAYEAELDRLRARAGLEGQRAALGWALRDNRYLADFGRVSSDPMFWAPDLIDEDVRRAMVWWDSADPLPANPAPGYSNEWFQTVFGYAMLAHAHHRAGDHRSAQELAESITASDWREACGEWLQRRRRRKK